MAGKSPPSAELVEEWTARLKDAWRDREESRRVAEEGEEKFRLEVCAAFDAGLTVTPISEALHLTPSRIYQIKAGRRT